MQSLRRDNRIHVGMYGVRHTVRLQEHVRWTEYIVLNDLFLPEEGCAQNPTWYHFRSNPQIHGINKRLRVRGIVYTTFLCCWSMHNCDGPYVRVDHLI